MKGSLPGERQSDLFRSRLDSILSMVHEICRLTNELDWDWLDKELSEYYSNLGRPSIPVRTISGMLLLN